MRSIGLLGGTFDPIHYGHLRLAVEVRERLGLDSMRLIPAFMPPLRDAPSASAELRLKMLRAAIEGTFGLEVDERELGREGVSYTVDTLRAFRAEYPDSPLCWIVGMDAFQRFTSWREWQSLPALAHFCIAKRPGSTPPREGPLGALVRAHVTEDPSFLRARPAGGMLFCELPALDISATYIRALVAEGRSPRFLVPDAVLNLIEEHRIYRDG